MQSAVAATMDNASNRALWAGWILSGLVVLFLLLDGAMKLVPLQPVIDASGQLGLPTDAATVRAMGLILIASTLLYAYPRTAALGAVLITAYLGGAVATHVRVASPLFSHTFFGVYLGVMAWGGPWFREPRLRALLPMTR